MRNEYTDYIAHGHKYFAVVDLGKKNSKGTKQRRYFYSANEYKNYLQGKKTLDDKLLGGVSKAYNKVKGLSAVAKTLPKLAKAAKETSKMTEGDRKAANVEGRAKRAGLKTDEGWYFAGHNGPNNLYKEATDKKGNKYLINSEDRKVYSYDGSKEHRKYVMNKGDSGEGKDQSKELIKKEAQAKKEQNKYKDIFKNTIKKPNQVPAILKPAQAAGKAIDKTVGSAIRENFVERMVEKGINKANAEATRKKLEEAYNKATTIGTAASNLKGRVDKLQEAMTSGDGDKLLDTMDEMLKDQENIQKDVLDIVDSVMPDLKKTADTFLDMGKKTLDTATAGPKAVSGDAVDEYLKEHGMTKEGVSKEFLDELRENLKRNRK